MAFLYRPGDVVLTKWGSFDTKGECNRSDLLEKNVYLQCDVLGVQTLFVNVHLKAQYDAPSAAIRKLEVEVLQSAVDKFRQQKSSDHPVAALCVLGDFNDFDCSVKCGKDAPIQSGVVESIKSWGKLETAVERVEPMASRSSTVYGDMIDHILVDGTFVVSQARVYHSDSDTAEMMTCNRTSDHFPLVAWLAKK